MSQAGVPACHSQSTGLVTQHQRNWAWWHMLLNPELEAKAGKSGIHSHSLLHSKFKTSLSYERLSQNTKQNMVHIVMINLIQVCVRHRKDFKLENPSSLQRGGQEETQETAAEGKSNSSAMIIPSAESFPASDTDTESPFQLYTRRFFFVQSRAKIHTQALFSAFLKHHVQVPLNAKYFGELMDFDLFLLNKGNRNTIACVLGNTMNSTQLNQQIGMYCCCVFPRILCL